MGFLDTITAFFRTDASSIGEGDRFGIPSERLIASGPNDPVSIVALVSAPGIKLTVKTPSRKQVVYTIAGGEQSQGIPDGEPFASIDSDEAVLDGALAEIQQDLNWMTREFAESLCLLTLECYVSSISEQQATERLDAMCVNAKLIPPAEKIAS